MHTDDVRIPQVRNDVGFAVQPFAIFAVGCEFEGQHLESIPTRQPRMVDEIHLAHAADPSARAPERPYNRRTHRRWLAASAPPFRIAPHIAAIARFLQFETFRQA